MKKIIFVSTLALSLVACDQISTKSVEAPRPLLTAVDINLQVLDLAKQGKPIDALKLGEEFLRSGSDPQGVLHATLARIYVDVGDTESSVRHLQYVNGAQGNSSMTVIVSREAAPSPAPVLPPPTVSAGVGAATGGASALIGPNGIEVRAGGASASVRN